jgi:hypothetical protein
LRAPRLRRLVILPVLVALLLAACTAEGSPPDDGTEPTPERTPPPALSLEVADGRTVPMRIGTYCYGALCVDAIGILTPDEPAVLERGIEVSLAGGAAKEPRTHASALLWPLPAVPVAEGEGWRAWHPGEGEVNLPLDGDAFTLPAGLSSGRYLLSVGIAFEQGDAQYGLILEVP